MSLEPIIHTSGLKTLHPQFPEWVLKVADRLHNLYDIRVDEVGMTSKNVYETQFRSNTHTIVLKPVRLEVNPNDEALAPLGKLNISSVVQYQPWTVQNMKEVEGGQIIGVTENYFTVQKQGPDNNASVNYYSLFANVEGPLIVPAHTLAVYCAGYTELVHTLTVPEQINSDYAKSVFQHRWMQGQSFIINSLANMLRHSAKDFTIEPMEVQKPQTPPSAPQSAPAPEGSPA